MSPTTSTRAGQHRLQEHLDRAAREARILHRDRAVGAGPVVSGRRRSRRTARIRSSTASPVCIDFRAYARTLPYVGLVASRRRGTGVLGELRSDGVPDELLGRIDVPAGLDIGARTPAEVALSILARIVEVRRTVRRLELPVAARRPRRWTRSVA